MRQVICAATAAILFVFPALGSDLVYTPINPAFGGNPMNSSHLLAVASAQRTATASDAPVSSPGTGGTGGGGGSSTSNVDLFISQLQGRLLSALASQVTDAIFGSNPQPNGMITFGDTTIVFDNTGATIELTITNNLTGEITIISVPQLVVVP
jgi:curli production assembly/transport component CsgF